MGRISWDNLPEGLISEILSWLPVKSVVACKSVSKSWLSTISNPDFTKSHLHHSMNHPILLNIIDTYGGICYDMDDQQRLLIRQLINQALLDTYAQDLSKIPMQIDRVFIPDCFLGFPLFVGCYNGIVCLSNRFLAYLWNPSIRRYKTLCFLEGTSDRMAPVGFGYDAISNDYKLIRFVYQNKEDFVGKVQVYSVNADCCRQLEAPVLKEITRRHMSTNVAVNGVLYFHAPNELVSFDLHKEVFGLVSFSSSFQRKRSDIMDFEGSLAMVFESGPGVVDLWVLDDKKLSWTKKFSFGCGLNDLDTEIWLSCYVGARQFCGEKLFDGIFMYDVVYDYEKKETKCYGLQELDEMHVRSHTVCKYTETLVALDGFEPVEGCFEPVEGLK